MTSGWVGIGRPPACLVVIAVTSVLAPDFVLRAGTDDAAAAMVHTVEITGDRRKLAWGFAVLSAGLATAGLAIGIGDGAGPREVFDTGSARLALMALTFPVLGALLVTRMSGNRLAWVFSAMGACSGLALLANNWALHDYRFDGGWPFAAELAFLAVAMVFVGPLLAPLTVLWFPDGQLPDGRARWRLAQRLVFVSAAGLFVVLSQAWSLRGPALVDNSPDPGGLVTIGIVVFAAGTAAGVLAGLAAVIARLRGSDGVVRQQVKWYLYGGVAAFVLNTAGHLVPNGGVLIPLGLLVFEAAVLVGVMRHALWDIDRLLNRTVVYGLLSVTIAAVYAGTVLGLGLLLGELSFARSISVAAATLAAAVITAPTRRALQIRVDRRFDRRTYDAARRMTMYGDQLSLAPPPPGELERLLREVLDDPELRLLFRCHDGELVDARGRAASEPTGVATSLRSATGELAVLEHRAFATDEQALFASVRRSAARAVALARLQAELLVQVTAVEHSRRRIVESADAERRRVERDLHDGAQQRLLALAMTLRSEQRRHAPELGPQAKRIIDLGVSEISGSVQDLRALAGGLLPGALVSEGLSAALRELVDRQPDPVQCVRQLDHRHAPEIEATAWFVASEGLANCLKHAPGSGVCIEVVCDGRQLQISVSDDGPGGAVDGPGLTGLEDRVLACAGTLQIHSPPGAGTCLVAVLPCG